MKKILFILFFISTSAFSQIYVGDRDTIPVWLLVSDITDEAKTKGIAVSVKAYQVREVRNHNLDEGYNNPDGSQNYWKHIKFLTLGKLDFPTKEWTIWQTKER